jgi:hypothetical protein
MAGEPLRRCLSCGCVAYLFKPCHTCRVLARTVVAS